MGLKGDLDESDLMRQLVKGLTSEFRGGDEGSTDWYVFDFGRVLNRDIHEFE
jgi:hypothetical protein